MQKCPICSNEYDKTIDERCATCGWDLSFYFKRESFKDKVTSFLGGEEEAFLKSAETWARWRWKELQNLNEALAKSQEKKEKLEDKLAKQFELEKKVEQLEKRLDEVLYQTKEERLLLLLEAKIEEKIAQELAQVNVSTTVYEPRSAMGYEESLFPQKEASLAEIYNDNFDSLSNCATKVEVTQESVQNIYYGKSGKIVLKENKKKGKYFVILWIDSKQYLVPVPNLLINEHSLRTLVGLFEIVNYREGESKSFQVVEAAEVYQREDEWELRVKGKINFD